MLFLVSFSGSRISSPMAMRMEWSELLIWDFSRERALQNMGWKVYVPTWMVDFYGKVGESTSPHGFLWGMLLDLIQYQLMQDFVRQYHQQILGSLHDVFVEKSFFCSTNMCLSRENPPSKLYLRPVMGVERPPLRSLSWELWPLSLGLLTPICGGMCPY